MFTDFFDYNLFLVESLLVLIIVLYIHLRIIRVLGKDRKILPFISKTFKYLNYVVGFFVSFFITISRILLLRYLLLAGKLVSFHICVFSKAFRSFINYMS